MRSRGRLGRPVRRDHGRRGVPALGRDPVRTARRPRSGLGAHDHPADRGDRARRATAGRGAQLRRPVVGNRAVRFRPRPGHRARAVRLLAAVYNAAVLDRRVASSPVVRIALPRAQDERVIPMTVGQVRALAEAMPPRNRAMVYPRPGSGVRVGELLALRAQDVDFLRRTARVEHQLGAAHPRAGASRRRRGRSGPSRCLRWSPNELASAHALVVPARPRTGACSPAPTAARTTTRSTARGSSARQ